MSRNTAHWRPNARRAGELLGMLIRDARVERGQTIEEAARMCGVSPRTFARVEHGEPTSSISVVFNIADRFGIPLFQASPDELDRIHAARSRADALLPRRVDRSALADAF